MANKQYQGYVIAQSRAVDAFFTSSSSYDRPAFVPLSEATKYPTAELANIALGKLLKHGAYSARITEASSLEFEFPDEGPNKDEEPITQTSGDMTTGQLSGDPLEDLNIEDDDIEVGDEFNQPEEDEIGDEDLTNAELNDQPADELDDQNEEENEQAFLSPEEQQLLTRGRPTGGIGESVTIPTRPPLNAKPDENNKTALDGKKAEVIKFNQDNRNDRDTNFSKDIEPLHHEVKVPASVLRAIKASIETFNDAADFNNGRDDSLASHALTVASALETIRDCLELGTHDGLRQAQIKFTSFMNPITSNFPPEVADYLLKFGRQPSSLKNAFYDKWETKRTQK